MSLRDTVADNCLQITEELIGPYVDKEELSSVQSKLSQIYTLAQEVLIELEESEVEDDYVDRKNPQPTSSKYEPKDLSQKGMKLVPGSNK